LAKTEKKWILGGEWNTFGLGPKNAKKPDLGGFSEREVRQIEPGYGK